ncbi:hypothetical protein Psuf_060420 [Phytohabitans suffuscus]|uniref:Uncharacterized protein n=1 Tax=Phytohabitans suffuscus TaxID=624315 RepID=A0A6F8YRP1_9ACTN|nr:hypothetical protein Psuf_060420 [Phytohabitans suffuscus]
MVQVSRAVAAEIEERFSVPITGGVVSGRFAAVTSLLGAEALSDGSLAISR